MDDQPETVEFGGKSEFGGWQTWEYTGDIRGTWYRFTRTNWDSTRKFMGIRTMGIPSGYNGDTMEHTSNNMIIGFVEQWYQKLQQSEWGKVWSTFGSIGWPSTAAWHTMIHITHQTWNLNIVKCGHGWVSIQYCRNIYLVIQLGVMCDLVTKSGAHSCGSILDFLPILTHC